LKADYTIKGNDQIITQRSRTTPRPSDAHGLSKCHSQSTLLSINGTSKDHGRRTRTEGHHKKREDKKKRKEKTKKQKTKSNKNHSTGKKKKKRE
jgi:hypothetical protein